MFSYFLCRLPFEPFLPVAGFRIFDVETGMEKALCVGVIK